MFSDPFTHIHTHVCVCVCLNLRMFTLPNARKRRIYFLTRENKTHTTEAVLNKKKKTNFVRASAAKMSSCLHIAAKELRFEQINSKTIQVNARKQVS